MAGVYRVGFDPRPAGRAIAGAITSIRKRKAEEEKAARKAAAEAEKARKRAIKAKARAEKAAEKAREAADKLSREQSGGLVPPEGETDLSISDERVENTSGFRPDSGASVVDPKSEPTVKFLRGYSERYGDAPDPYQGYASPGHNKASADRFGELSY